MTLEKLQTDMIAALKAGDKDRKAVISGLVDAVKKAGIDKKCRDNIPEDIVDAVILKEQKTAKEMLETCPLSRTDLMTEYLRNYKIVCEYAPQMMSTEEVKNYVNDVIKNIQPIKSNKGKIMKACGALKGKADMKQVAQIVDEVLKEAEVLFNEAK